MRQDAPDHLQPQRPAPPSARRWKRIRRWILLVYAVLLVASWSYLEWRGPLERHPPDPPEEAEPGAVELRGSAGGGEPVTLAYLRWRPPESDARARFDPDPDPPPIPVVLIHGGPGEAAEWRRLAPLLTTAGGARRDVYAVDLPGFGRSSRRVPDYSILAAAKAVLAWMDEIGLERIHLVGWSQGGGVVLHMCDIAPERIASLTLLASIGMQQTEGSGSYRFEHFRYAVGDWLRRAVPVLIPHFGLIQTAPPAFTRYFGDSDQRALESIMRSLRIPTLILHGRADFLVPDWAAVLTHKVIQDSRLVMTSWTHFIPHSPEAVRSDAAAWMGSLWVRHDPPDVQALGGYLDLAPRPRLFGKTADPVADWITSLPWWAVAAALMALTSRRGPGVRWAPALAAGMVVTGLLDYGVAWVGLTAGAWAWLLGGAARGGIEGAAWPAALRLEWRERLARGFLWAAGVGVLRPDLRDEAAEAIGACARGHLEMGRIPARLMALAMLLMAGLVAALHQLLLLISAMIPAALIMRDPRHPWGEAGVIAALIAARLSVGLVDHLATIPGRRLLRASISRALRFEFWPSWMVYAGLIPVWIKWALRTGHPFAFTACNPGIENGGGAVGESKYAIMHALRRDAQAAGLAPDLVRAVCETHFIDEGDPAARADQVQALVDTPGLSVNYPAILKPDSGYRGFSVRIVASRRQAESYFRMMPRPALLQPLHEGPCEVGVLWIRSLPADPLPLGVASPLKGRIFSITTKHFPFVEGDGRRTLEELIYRHPRYRLQARIFLARFRGRRLEVPCQGERIRLAASGNHCQGALFRDGAHLITPALEATIDAIALSFRGRADQPCLDLARLDIRYHSEADLVAGRLEPDSIVELNGTFGESTNIYDPDKPVRWAYGYLARQWAALYQLGAARIRQGHRPMTVRAFLRELFRHYRRREGSALAD